MEYQYVDQSIKKLERFQGNFSLASASMEEIENLKQELRFLRTYLMYVEISKGKHEPQGMPCAFTTAYELCVLPKLKISDLSSIERAFIDANTQLHKAIDEIYLCRGRTSSADPPVTSMLKVIKDFQPQIEEAYTVFLEKQSSRSVLKSYPQFWKVFTGSVLENLNDLLDSKSLIGSVRKSVESFRGKLKLLPNFVHWPSADIERYAQIAACLSYLGWVDEMDENALSHLLQEINPSTPEVMEEYFVGLKDSMHTRSNNAKTEKVESFVSFLMYDTQGSMKKDQFAAIRDGLAFLITFVMGPDECTRAMDPPKPDELTGATDLSESEPDESTGEMELPESDECTGVMDLPEPDERIEATDLPASDSESELTEHAGTMDLSESVPDECTVVMELSESDECTGVIDLPEPDERIEATDLPASDSESELTEHAGTMDLSESEAESESVPDECTGDQERIEADIQAVAREAVCFTLQFHVNEEELSRLLEKMKLIKAEIDLIELIRSQHPMEVYMEDKFAALHEGLKFLRTLFVGLEEETLKDSKMFFSQFGKMADEVTSLISSIRANIETGEMPIKINLALALFLEKIKLIESEVCLMKLQNHKTNWMIATKDQIEVLRQGLGFLRTLLMDSTDIEDKTEEGKLFLTYLQAVTIESSSLIPSMFASEPTEEMVTKMSFLVSTLVENIKLLKAEMVLEELLNHENGTIVQIKVQIRTFKEGLTLLKSFLIDPPREHKENGKMILERSESMVNEAASLICSVYDDLMEEGKAMEIALGLSKLLGKLMDIKAEIVQLYLHVSKPLQSKHPRTDVLGFVSSLLGYLKELQMLNSDTNSIAFGKHQLEMLYKELDFLIDIVEQHKEHEELKALWTCVTDIAYDAENVIDSFVVRKGPLWYRMLQLSVVIEEINAVKANVMETYDKTRFDKRVRNIAQTPNHMPSKTNSPMLDEVMVGFTDEADEIIGQLTRGSQHMDIVSIVGMPGLGKTTLAKKVYNDRSVTFHFHVRAWCCISQFYQKRELLLDILGDIVELTDEIRKMTDEDIAAKLRQCLKGRKYLIVMDDLWDIKAWEYLRLSFPDDSNGSRVLFTSRLRNVVLQAKPDSHPHHLRLLSDDESWDLLQKKLFPKEDCPEPLKEVGKVIATNCKGLPLAVVVIAGLLGRTEKKLDWWKQVSQSLNSQIVADPQGQCRYVLELSYKHLSDRLKSCFLYFGAFPEHKDIPVSKFVMAMGR